MAEVFFQDTIAALASVPGRSALALIRVSGPKAISILRGLWCAREKAPGDLPAARTQSLGIISDPSGQIIDEVMLSYFVSPASYTGEDLAEIQCHGNPLIVEKILHSLCALGARLAEPGEFTKRAFLNDKIDLVQAEAVSQVIEARTQGFLTALRGQYSGAFSQRVLRLRQTLVEMVAWVEADIDFGDREVDDVVAVESTDLRLRLTALREETTDILLRVEQTKKLREGVQIVLAGRSNVGKSSLFNQLYGIERAMVDSQPGTTRDYLEAWFEWAGIACRLVDTAGFRDKASGLEAQGMKRSQERLEKAELVLAVFDQSLPFQADDQKFLTDLFALKQTSVLALLNKSDLPECLSQNELRERLMPLGSQLQGVMKISAHQPEGAKDLERKMVEWVQQNAGAGEESGQQAAFLLTLRQTRIFREIEAALTRCLISLEQGFSTECLSGDLRQAVNGFSRLSGREISADDPNVELEEILSEVFSHFCIGK